MLYALFDQIVAGAVLGLSWSLEYVQIVILWFPLHLWQE